MRRSVGRSGWAAVVVSLASVSCAGPPGAFGAGATLEVTLEPASSSVSSVVDTGLPPSPVSDPTPAYPGVVPSAPYGPSDTPTTLADGTEAVLETVPDDQILPLLREWDQALAAASPDALVVAGPLWNQTGVWPVNGGPNREPIIVGDIDYSPPEVAAVASPTTGPVVHAGRRLTVPLIDPAAAVEEIRTLHSEGDCGGCGITLIDPTLITVRLTTSTGDASVPAWDFNVSGTGDHISWVAVDPALLVGPRPHPLWGSNGGEIPVVTGPSSLAIRTPGSEPACGRTPTARAVESERTYAIAITTTIVPIDGYCTAIGYYDDLTVELAAPIGDRLLINLDTGLAMAAELPR
jgi:hypothetical protein